MGKILSNLEMIESRGNPIWMLIMGLVGKIVFNIFCSQRVFLQAVKSFKSVTFACKSMGMSLLDQGLCRETSSVKVMDIGGGKHWWGKSI
jgi:hypothetical protein